jgi:hypothetical protein
MAGGGGARSALFHVMSIKRVLAARHNPLQFSIIVRQGFLYARNDQLKNYTLCTWYKDVQ